MPDPISLPIPDPGTFGSFFSVMFVIVTIGFLVIGAIAVVSLFRGLARASTNGSRAWTIDLAPSLVLPGSSAIVTATFAPGKTLSHRGIRAEFSCVERYEYEETVRDAEGHTRTERRWGSDTLHAESVSLAPVGEVGPEGATFTFELPIPALAVPTYEGATLKVTWLLRVLADVPGLDIATNAEISVGAPIERISAGVMDLAAGAPMIEVAVEGGRISIEPIPLDLAAPARATIALDEVPAGARGVRIALVSRARVLHAGGLDSTRVLFETRLPALPADGIVELPGPHAVLPDLDSPHGRARGELAVSFDLAGQLDHVVSRPVAMARGRLGGTLVRESPTAG